MSKPCKNLIPECCTYLGNDIYLCHVTGRKMFVRKNELPLHCNHAVACTGPGDYLHLAILKWVGEGPTQKCGCTDRIREMNAWGPGGCREHLGEIVDWLANEAKRRGWWKYAVAVPGSKLFIRRMVLGAIRQAE